MYQELQFAIAPPAVAIVVFLFRRPCDLPPVMAAFKRA
jgi:hypothetical protein